MIGLDTKIPPEIKDRSWPVRAEMMGQFFGNIQSKEATVISLWLPWIVEEGRGNGVYWVLVLPGKTMLRLELHRFLFLVYDHIQIIVCVISIHFYPKR